MILSGTYHNGTIVLEDEVPFQEGEKVQFEIVQKSPPPLKKRLTVEELDELTRKHRINTNGWKFNRDEANER